jgi:hypothetical protein
MSNEVRHLGSTTRVRVKRNKVSVWVLVWIGAFIAVSAVLVSYCFGLDIVENLVMAWILTVVYVILAFLIYESYIIKETDHNYLREIEKEVPILKEYFHTIDNPIIHVVEKPVYRQVYIEKERKRLNIPHYDFVGSTETRTFHKRNCRLGKLIKKKYKLQNNSMEFFKKKGFKGCKMCIKRQILILK